MSMPFDDDFMDINNSLGKCCEDDGEDAPNRFSAFTLDELDLLQLGVISDWPEDPIRCADIIARKRALRKELFEAKEAKR